MSSEERCVEEPENEEAEVTDSKYDQQLSVLGEVLNSKVFNSKDDFMGVVLRFFKIIQENSDEFEKTKGKLTTMEIVNRNAHAHMKKFRLEKREVTTENARLQVEIGRLKKELGGVKRKFHELDQSHTKFRVAIDACVRMAVRKREGIFRSILPSLGEMPVDSLPVHTAPVVSLRTPLPEATEEEAEVMEAGIVLTSLSSSSSDTEDEEEKETEVDARVDKQCKVWVMCTVPEGPLPDVTSQTLSKQIWNRTLAMRALHSLNFGDCFFRNEAVSYSAINCMFHRWGYSTIEKKSIWTWFIHKYHEMESSAE